MSGSPNNNSQKLNNMKRNLTLDFNQAKKPHLNLSAGNSVLSSPDLNMLKVGTPELEKMILANGISTSTPTPSGLIYSRTVAEDPETFASGFVNALNDLHNNANTSSASDNSSSATVYADLEQPTLGFLPPIIKEEPQTVPNIHSSSPPMSPVDMEAQERIKLERKRQRNRLAASKCRTRKLERISRLEDKVKHLKGENVELASLVNQLKEQVGILKVEVMDHVQAGCNIMM
ncbi:hypothetical protein RI129_009265 [Pyrocoelia pectoralis]|uniref:BZIP domain-containing protein n=1 Tax=Pyrocoelia pectoralis TaxID=417401 RepID=A0AAN7ZIU6_9COLE